MDRTNLPSPLEGLKVLDMSRVLAGPFAGRMLRDMGADVVKVEPPEGDVTRFWGKVVGGVAGFYNQQNAGKRNVCIDLRAEGARELVIDLARKADLLIENYRPDVMSRLGLSWEELSAANPRLVMLSISGFGRNGPESRRPAYAPIVHAELGLLERAQRRNGGPPPDLPVSIADTNASLHGLVGALSALLLRERTGRGQHIDLAMIDATAVTDDQLHYELENSGETMGLPPEVWTTGCGDILISTDFRLLFRLLGERHGLADPASGQVPLDEKIRLRREAVGTFMAGLATWDDVEAAMAKMNMAWGQVRSAFDLRDQATVRHRGTIAQIDDRAGGTRPIPQSPYHFSDANAFVRGGAPHRGEHNAEVLAEWLGLGDGEVSSLVQRGVLLSA